MTLPQQFDHLWNIVHRHPNEFGVIAAASFLLGMLIILCFCRDNIKKILKAAEKQEVLTGKLIKEWNDACDILQKIQGHMQAVPIRKEQASVATNLNTEAMMEASRILNEKLRKISERAAMLPGPVGIPGQPGAPGPTGPTGKCECLPMVLGLNKRVGKLENMMCIPSVD